MNRQVRNSASYSRFDADSAGRVERAIALQATVGTAYAAVYLKSEGMPSATILRVLLRRDERRGRAINVLEIAALEAVAS